MGPLQNITNTAAADTLTLPPQPTRQCKRKTRLYDNDVVQGPAAKRAKVDTDTRVAETASPVLEQGAGLSQVEMEWLSSESFTPIPQEPSREGEWKEVAEAPSVSSKVSSPLLQVSNYFYLFRALHAHTALTSPKPKSEEEVIKLVETMAEKGLTREVLKALALPGEVESKRKGSQDQINNDLEKAYFRCIDLSNLKSYLVNELGLQKELSPITIQKAIQMGLKLITKEDNLIWGHFKTLEVDNQLFLLGHHDHHPTFVFFKQKLGQGSYGIVHKVVLISRFTPADTTKAFKHSYTNTKKYDSYDSLEKEITTLKQIKTLNHKETCLEIDFSLKLVTQTKVKQIGYLAPLCQSDLVKFLKSNPSVKERFLWARHFISLVVTVLKTGIIPTDIKPDNTLVLEGNLRFGDLMATCLLSEVNNFDIKAFGTHQYVCPVMQERVLKVIAKRDVSKRSEVLIQRMLYSCASTLYEIFVGHFHYPRPCRKDGYPDFNFPIYTRPLEAYPESLTLLMQELLHVNPDLRPQNWNFVGEIIAKVEEEIASNQYKATVPISTPTLGNRSQLPRFMEALGPPPGQMGLPPFTGTLGPPRGQMGLPPFTGTLGPPPGQMGLPPFTGTLGPPPGQMGPQAAPMGLPPGQMPHAGPM
ncbi:MAG: hypothetical protein H0X51_06375 [Parachlamydiaceae bacterium]|nr:hypothetical protein [Parachlamydiaceae bacterium]